MPGLNDLYQEILLEHNSKPHNFRKMEEATQSAEGFNPLCGDIITVFLSVDDGVITDVSFQGSGCAISRASASMMTQSVKGKSTQEAEETFEAFRLMMTDLDAELDYDTLGDLESLSGVVEFPTRIKCAVLAWHTLRAALDGQSEAVTTE
ncbi:MAG: SUF system NifU family Fe-S cluster assembly protein [SAR202 cluster bacterium Io17-Chloro-G4]|nr:MAG: SUF system NifU family Fe-S cluster assembly protein [SAR202 cluster bacterium Io17-Chloro-G4]